MLDAIFYSAGAVLGIFVGVYFYFFFSRYAKVYKEITKKESTKRQNIFFKTLQIVLSIGLGVTMVFISYTPALIVGHFFAFSLIFDALFLIIRRCFKNNKQIANAAKILHYSRILPIIACVAVLIYGFVNMGIIVKTDYSFSDQKVTKTDGYKIALITDAHYDTVQDTEVFRAAIDEISALDPDIVILAGDIVDESTSKEKMQECFAVIGNIDARYGTYFVYGNHDRQAYMGIWDRTYTDQELTSAIEDAGITILTDEVSIINNDLMLIGRQDPSNVEGERTTVEDIVAGYDLKDYYTIVLDHQPEKSEFSKNAELKIDLQLSGHTHGGQIFPVGLFLSMIGTPNYGQYQVEDFTAIVSSGITGWGYPFRTESICEYVIISVTP